MKKKEEELKEREESVKGENMSEEESLFQQKMKIQKEIHFPNSEQIHKEIEDTKIYPYCSIGLLTGKFGEKEYFGTGCLIAPSVVLTCAHNLYNR